MNVSELTSLNFRLQLCTRTQKRYIDYSKCIGLKNTDSFGGKIMMESLTNPPREPNAIDFLI